MDKILVTEEVHRKIAEITTALDEHPKSMEFRVPVDWEAFGLTDYPILIKNPMDLGTVISKLSDDKYENVAEWESDISLIWNNCKCYNRQGSVSSSLLIFH